MGTDQETTASATHQPSVVLDFLDNCSTAFGVLTAGGVSGVLLLDLIYTIFPPPLHPIVMIMP